MKILLYPNPILRKMAEPIATITPEIEFLAMEMTKTLLLSGGVGISAPQVGRSVKIIVIKTSLYNLIDQQAPFCTMINPVIISKKGKMIEMVEYCLSVPNTGIRVRRIEEVEVEYLNLEGKSVTVRLKGINSRCVQHEIDHLSGKLLVDYR